MISGYCQILWFGRVNLIERAKKAFFEFIVELINILELIVFGKGNRIVFRK